MQKLILLVVVLLVTTYTYAQKGLEIGVQFTPGVSLIINDEDFAEGDDLNFKGSFGYNVGLNLGYNFTDGIGLSSGVLFSQTRQNYVTDYDNRTKSEQNTFYRQLSYIRIPVLFRFSGDVTSQTSAFFRIGPHFDLLSAAKYEYDDKSIFDLDRSYNMRDYKDILGNERKIYKNFVVGLTLEMGGIVRISESMGIFFMLHLEGSLTNTEDEESGYVYPSSGFPNYERAQAFNVMGGLTVGYNYVIDFSK